MKRATLASLCERISSGGTPSRKHAEYFAGPGSHPWVKSQELLDRPISDTDETISDLGLTNSSAKYFPAKTILLAMYGANVGQLAILEMAATVNQAICALCVDPEKADHRYVFYALRATRHDLAVQAAGAAQQNLNQGLIRDFEIPIYPLEVQRAIADTLGAFDDLIENNYRRMAILDDMARLVFREWFTALRFPGHERTDFMESGVGSTPKGWEVCSLGDFVTVNRESVRTGDALGEILYVDISSVGPRRMDPPQRVDFAEAPSRARRVVTDGDTIWSTVRPNRRSHALMIEPEPNVICSTGLAVLSPEAMPSSFVFELSSSAEFTAHLEARATGAAYPAVRPEDFESFEFLHPGDEVLDDFDRVVAPMHRLHHVLARQVTCLSSARDLLLPRLIAGELDISRVDDALESVA